MQTKFKIEIEKEFSFDETSEVACRAFGKATAELSARRFQWAYQSGYADVSIVSAFSEDKKIGQAGAIFKTVNIGSEKALCAELIDLFMIPDSENFKIVSKLYQSLRYEVERKGVKYIYTHSNSKAFVLNKRFFRLSQSTLLPIRVGVSGFFRHGSSGAVIRTYKDKREISAQFCKFARNEFFVLDEEAFFNRINSPIYDYLLTSDGNLAALCSPRTVRNRNVLLVCGIYCRDPTLSSKTDLRKIVAKSCSASGRLVYIYVGRNRDFGDKIGFELPGPWSSRAFSIQSNFLQDRLDEIDKFELIDLDYG